MDVRGLPPGTFMPAEAPPKYTTQNHKRRGFKEDETAPSGDTPAGDTPKPSKGESKKPKGKIQKTKDGHEVVVGEDGTVYVKPKGSSKWRVWEQ